MPTLLSVDGGGTKLFAVLFDESMNILSIARESSVNTNFEAVDAVERHMSNCIRRCLAPWLADNPGKFPLACYACIVGPMDLFRSVIEREAPGCRLVPVQEGMMHCLSGSLSQSGIVALSGTGSGVALCVNGAVQSHLGGWGSLVGDEGSGYAIGRDGIAAVIRAHDGWGKTTLMTELLVDRFKLKKLHELLPAIYQSPNPRSTVAAFAPEVGRAAAEGDEVALQVVEKAASMLASQIGGLFALTGCSPEAYEVTACGGAWKGCDYFFETFAGKLYSKYPGIRVCRARYGIEAGGAALHLLREDPTRPPQEIERLLTPGFDEFNQTIHCEVNHDQPSLF